MNVSPFLRNLGVLALIAVLVVVFNLETSLSVAALLVRFVVVIAVVVAVYLIWRDFGRREIALWPARAQWTLYGAAALLVADIVWWYTTLLAGPNALVAVLTLAASVYAGIRTWRDQTRL